MKRTHRWAAMMTALVLAAGTVVPTSAWALSSLLKPPDVPNQPHFPWEMFGEPEQPGGRAGRIVTVNLGVLGPRVIFVPGQRSIVQRTSAPTSSANRGGVRR